MERSFKLLVDALSITPFSINILREITLLLEQQTPELFSSFVTQSIQSLSALKYWAWDRLSHDSHQWINQPNYMSLFHTLASFNKNLIFNYDDIDDETKASLLIPHNVDQINGIFEQINQSNDDNDPFIGIASLWFDNLSLFIIEHPQFDLSSTICYINQYIGRNYLMTNQFKFYLTQLQQPQISQRNFSLRQLFYIRTCSFSLDSHLSAHAQSFPFPTEEILHHIGNEYLQIINIHSRRIEFWNKELLICITHLTRFIFSCLWLDEEKSAQIKTFFPTEQILCDFIEVLIRIISYQPFYKEIKPERSNTETILLDIILRFILMILQTLNINWYFRSILSLPDTLLFIGQNSPFDEISLCSYAILGEVLIDEKLKELPVTDNIPRFLANIFNQAWHHPSKKYKHISLLELLRGFWCLTKSDAIKQKVADSHKLPLLFEMCDQYPIVYDILWSLSFNQDIQEQLRSNPAFMAKLSYLGKECDNEQLRKIAYGLLWNLEINHPDHSISEINDRGTFDIMISYSHKDKVLCKQIYDELIKSGYRVWIDFDQMHGNIMDAMAEAIERSHTIIICMSENYRRSNYCRAEAHYAFQRQRKIVPVLSQQHYKPDGWLLFLIGQLLYVDFIKHEFSRAMTMLCKELKRTNITKTDVAFVQPERNITDTAPKLHLPSQFPNSILDWTQRHVQEWLTGHNLNQMSHLLADCNGRSLLYLDDYIRNGDMNQILNLLQEDSLRKTGQTLSLTELSCFRSLMDEQKQLMVLSISIKTKMDNVRKSF